MSVKQPPRPTVDHWYKTINGDVFEVVSVDEKDDAIEIQYLDGALEGLDEDSWVTLHPKVIDPPRESLAEDYEGKDGEADYPDAADLEGIEGEWPGSFDDYE